MKKLALVLLAGSLFIFGSCRGPKGDPGVPGAQGNANVIGSDPFAVTIWNYNSAEVAYEASFNDADITTAVANHGVVEVFLFYPSDQTWRPLPDIVANTEFYFRFNAGGFDIYYANVDGSVPTAPTGTFTFRTVVIDPSNKAAHPNTNWKDYNQVMSVLNEQNAQATTATPLVH